MRKRGAKMPQQHVAVLFKPQVVASTRSSLDAVARGHAIGRAAQGKELAVMGKEAEEQEPLSS
jgi:hypothetical protein